MKKGIALITTIFLMTLLACSTNQQEPPPDIDATVTARVQATETANQLNPISAIADGTKEEPSTIPAIPTNTRPPSSANQLARGQVRETTIGNESCDDFLLHQMVYQRNVHSHESFNTLITVIQNQRPDCTAQTWNPKVADAYDVSATPPTAGCTQGTIADMAIPTSLQKGGTENPDHARHNSTRDKDNNIIVHWDYSQLPDNGAKCWLYVARLNTWFIEGNEDVLFVGLGPMASTADQENTIRMTFHCIQNNQEFRASYEDSMKSTGTPHLLIDKFLNDWNAFRIIALLSWGKKPETAQPLIGSTQQFQEQCG